MRILLPLDLTQPIQPVVDEMKRLIKLQGAQVRLLYVRELLPAYENVMRSVGDYEDEMQRQVQEKTRAVFAEAESLLKPHCQSVDSEVVSGPRAMMIESVARDHKADLTIVTPAPSSTARKFFVGSVSSKVAKHGPGTVLVCRPGKRSGAASVVLATDGSADATFALQQAVKMFNLGTVTVVHSVDVAEPFKMFSPVAFIGQVEANLLMEGETFLATANKQLADLGIGNVDIQLKEGDPANRIIDVAEEKNADLIVLGAKGLTAVQHFLLGSVSHKTATHAACSVAIVKRGA